MFPKYAADTTHSAFPKEEDNNTTQIADAPECK